MMFTVSILINGQPILTRSARRISGKRGKCLYNVDDGNTVEHKPTDGAVVLAKKLLDLIEEP